MGIKHLKTLGTADGPDTSKVRPSDWEADHVIDDPAAVRDALELGTAALADTGDFADASHTHAQSDITSLTGDLAAKLVKASNLSDLVNAGTARGNLGLGTAATLDADTDVTLAANSDVKLATQKAVKAYIASVITGGASDVMIFKGVIDCSANPNYPAADAGHLYKVSVAGKIGGASGAVVEPGDTLYCITDSTASGTQAGVGAAWVIVQVNVDGAVVGPTSSVASEVALYDGTTGKLIKRATGTGFLHVTSGVLDTPSAALAQSDITSLVSDLALKAPLVSPALTSVPTAPTAAAGTNTTQLSTCAFVHDAVIAAGGIPSLPAFPSISGLELRLSARLSTITHANDGLVTAVTDLSGNGRTGTAATTARPRYYPKHFNGGFPCLAFNGTSNWLSVTMPTIAQPFTVVIVLANYAGGTSNQHLYRDSTPGAVGYISGGQWLMYSSAVLTATGLLTQNGAAPLYNSQRGTGDVNHTTHPAVRIDVYDGASSLCSNNGVDVTGTVGVTTGSGTDIRGTFGIGADPALSGVARMLLYEFLVFSVALTSQNRIDLRTYYNDPAVAGIVLI